MTELCVGKATLVCGGQTKGDSINRSELKYEKKKNTLTLFYTLSVLVAADVYFYHRYSLCCRISLLANQTHPRYPIEILACFKWVWVSALFWHFMLLFDEV